MSDVAILKEFLVAVGFKVDNAQYAKMQERIKQVTTAVTEMAAAVSVAVEAVRIGVADMNGQLEGLYYASQRISSSVKDISAFGYAISQMGGDAKSAQQSVENLVEKMKENPGTRGLLNGLGVATPLNPDGSPQNGVKVMRDLSKALQTMDYRIAVQRANQLGIDINTLQAIRRGDLDKYLADYDKLSKDADQQKAAAGAHAFMVQWRRLGAEFNIFAGLIAERWAPIIGAAADALTALINVMISLDQETGGVTTLLVSAAAVMASMATAVGIVSKLLGLGKGGVAASLIDVEGAAVPLVGTLAGLAAALSRLAGIAIIVTAIIAAANLMSGAGGTPKKMLDVEGTAKDPAKADDASLAAAIDFFQKQVAAAPPQYAAKDKQILAALIQEQQRRLKGPAMGAQPAGVAPPARDPNSTAPPAAQDGAPQPQGPRPGNRAAPAAPAPQAPVRPAPAKDLWGDVVGQLSGVADRIRAAIAAAVTTTAPAAHGTPGPWGSGVQPKNVTEWARAAASYFRPVFGDAGAKGIAAGIFAEGGTPGARDPYSTARGLGQWLQKRQKDFLALYGKPLKDSTGWEQLHFMAWELTHTEKDAGNAIRAAKDPFEALRAYITKDMRPGSGTGGDLRRGAAFLNSGALMGGPSVTFAQTTTIVVQGGGDPNATGKAVAGEQSRVNGDLVRSLKGTVR